MGDDCRVGPQHPSTGKPTDALLLESNLDLDGKNVLFGRAEYVRKTGEDLDVAEVGAVYNLGAISFGYLRNFKLWDAFEIAPGVMVTVNLVDGRLERRSITRDTGRCRRVHQVASRIDEDGLILGHPKRCMTATAGTDSGKVTAKNDAFTAVYAAHSMLHLSDGGSIKMLRAISRIVGVSPEVQRAFGGWVVIFLMMMMLGEIYLRSSTPAAVALNFAEHDAAVQQAMGGVKHARLNWIGNIHYDGDDGWATFKMHLTGARSRGTMDVLLQRQRGEWNVASGRLVTDSGEVVSIDEHLSGSN